jgi:hypothetical protein
MNGFSVQLLLPLAMLAGGFVLLVIDTVFKKQTIESEDQDEFFKLIYYWLLAGNINGSGSKPQCSIYYWRYAAKTDKKPCCRVFIFPRSTYYVCSLQLIP